MEVQEFLEHHGIKGQKWGVRRTRFSNWQTKRAQNQINRLDRIATGKAKEGDKFKAARQNLVFTQKSAQKVLNRTKRNQDALLSGEHQVSLWINDKFGAIKIRDLRVHSRAIP